MTTPDFKKYGYEPEADAKNYFSYVNKNHKHGLPYRIDAAPDGDGGWGVSIHWKKAGRHDPNQQTTFYDYASDRFGAAMTIEQAMKEYSEENYGRGSSVDPEFDFGGGL